jgi:hypothetical protein
MPFGLFRNPAPTCGQFRESSCPGLEALRFVQDLQPAEGGRRHVSLPAPYVTLYLSARRGFSPRTQAPGPTAIVILSGFLLQSGEYFLANGPSYGGLNAANYTRRAGVESARGIGSACRRVVLRFLRIRL